MLSRNKTAIWRVNICPINKAFVPIRLTHTHRDEINLYQNTHCFMRFMVTTRFYRTQQLSVQETYRLRNPVMLPVKNWMPIRYAREPKTEK